MRLSLWALWTVAFSGKLSFAVSVSECKCSPSDSCWPSLAEWKSLNQSLSGRLIKTVPPASVCYRSQENHNSTQCAKILKEWQTSEFHSSHPATVLDPFWSGDACEPLYPNGTSLSGNPDAESKGCSLGNLSPYVINATTAKHVQVALKFAKEKNIRINVKNTGHNPEKSSAYGSLGIWTHRMKDFKFHKSFKACNHSEPHMAGTVGAGLQDGELFAAMAKHNAIAVGGTNTDVGIAGWSAGGGHGYATGIYGMGADNILELKIVTPHGEIVTANECQHSDLFWALRGGGGSTFGVIINITLKAHPMPSVGIVNFDVSPRNGTSTSRWWVEVAKIHKELADLQDSGYSGYYTITGPPLQFHYTCFVYDVGSAKEARKLVQDQLPEKTLFHTSSIVNTEISEIWTSTWYELVQKMGHLAESSNVGVSRSIRATRLLPRRAIDNTALFAETLQKIGPQSTASNNGVSTPSLSGTMTISKTPVDSALNPAWRDAVVHIITQQTWDDTLPDANATEAIHQMTYDKGYTLRQLAPDSGAYINEANPYEPDWQWSFWGPNYSRLLKIKEKYDPGNILWCRTCVGSEQMAQAQNGSLCRAL